jgi:hypothetical protein
MDLQASNEAISLVMRKWPNLGYLGLKPVGRRISEA